MSGHRAAELLCPRRRAYHSVPRKMADARPTLSPAAAIYARRLQKQFSRPMTGHTPRKLPFFRRNLPHHRSARAECPYTRSIMIPSIQLFVKNFFRKIYKKSKQFSVISQNFIYTHKSLSCSISSKPDILFCRPWQEPFLLPNEEAGYG